eukprot:901340-Lingulodinium_polyedra.AAC.1
MRLRADPPSEPPCWSSSVVPLLFHPHWFRQPQRRHAWRCSKAPKRRWRRLEPRTAAEVRSRNRIKRRVFARGFRTAAAYDPGCPACNVAPRRGLSLRCVFGPNSPAAARRSVASHH